MNNRQQESFSNFLMFFACFVLFVLGVFLTGKGYYEFSEGKKLYLVLIILGILVALPFLWWLKDEIKRWIALVHLWRRGPF